MRKNIKIELVDDSSLNDLENEDKKLWNYMLDILNAMNQNTKTVTLLELCYVHDMHPRYYERLSELVDRKLIKIEE